MSKAADTVTPEILKAWRKKHGYTQRKAADVLRVSRRTYAYWLGW